VIKYSNLKDVFFDSKFHVGRGLATYDKSLDHAIFNVLPDFSSIISSETAMAKLVNSETIMEAIADSEIAMRALTDSLEAMNIIADSQIAMKAIASSGIAMDVIATSDMAMDIVDASPVAMDAIADSSIAITKFIISRAGLNPTNYKDMSLVANSSTAMNAISISEAAMNAMVSSRVAMDAVAASETAVQAITQQRLPYEFSNARASYDSGTNSMIYIRRLQAEKVSNFIYFKKAFDFTDKNTLNIYVSANTLGQASSRMYAVVRIGNVEVLNLAGTNTDLIERTLDVSEINGKQTLFLGYTSSTNGDTDAYYVQHGRFYLR
jgi:nitrogen regulatory protein PII-like uncharacterized protein